MFRSIWNFVCDNPAFVFLSVVCIALFFLLGHSAAAQGWYPIPLDAGF